MYEPHDISLLSLSFTGCVSAVLQTKADICGMSAGIYRLWIRNEVVLRTGYPLVECEAKRALPEVFYDTCQCNTKKDKFSGNTEVKRE